MRNGNTMRKTNLLISIGLLIFGTVIGQAQASRTWVSRGGDDINPCSSTATCKTFPGAISSAGGEIGALDPVGYGAVVNTKVITIDGGDGQIASVLIGGTDGIVVQANTLIDVATLTNLRINGIGTGINGVRFLSGKALFVENTDSISGFAINGIALESSFQLLPAVSAFDYDASTIENTIPYHTPDEWLNSALVTDTNGINSPADVNNAAMPSSAYLHDSAKISDIPSPLGKNEITGNEVPLRTISSATTRTIGEEVELPNFKDGTGHWPTAIANGSRTPIPIATVKCTHGGEPGGELCAVDIVAGISDIGTPAVFISRQLTRTLE